MRSKLANQAAKQQSDPETTPATSRSAGEAGSGTTAGAAPCSSFTLRACPHCGGAVLLELESSVWEISARLWRTSDGTFVTDDGDDCEWIDERYSGDAIVGCACCNSRFNDDEIGDATETIEVNQALKLLSRTAKASPERRAPTSPVDADGRVHPNLPGQEHPQVNCPECGGDRWLLLANDDALCACLCDPDDDHTIEEHMITGGITGWELLGCASCGRAAIAPAAASAKTSDEPAVANGLRLWEVSFPHAGHIVIVQAGDEETAQPLAIAYCREYVADLDQGAEAETLELHLLAEPGVIANYWGSNEGG